MRPRPRSKPCSSATLDPHSSRVAARRPTIHQRGLTINRRHLHRLRGPTQALIGFVELFKHRILDAIPRGIDRNGFVPPGFGISFFAKILSQTMSAGTLVLELDLEGQGDTPVATTLAGIEILGPGVFGLDLVVEPVSKELPAIAHGGEVLLGLETRLGIAPGAHFGPHGALEVELPERYQARAPINAIGSLRPGAARAPANEAIPVGQPLPVKARPEPETFLALPESGLGKATQAAIGQPADVAIASAHAGVERAAARAHGGVDIEAAS